MIQAPKIVFKKKARLAMVCYDPFLSEDKHVCNRAPFNPADNLETAFYVEM